MFKSVRLALTSLKHCPIRSTRLAYNLSRCATAVSGPVNGLVSKTFLGTTNLLHPTTKTMPRNVSTKSKCESNRNEDERYIVRSPLTGISYPDISLAEYMAQAIASHDPQLVAL